MVHPHSTAMQKSPTNDTSRTPTTPRTSFKYSVSAAEPVLLDIHVPFVLLGPKKSDPGLIAGSGRYRRRLEKLYRALVEILDGERRKAKKAAVPFELWQPEEFEGNLTGGETTEERENYEYHRTNWREQEQTNWKDCTGKDGWVLRATPRLAEEEPLGMWDGWREGDGLLTERESAVVLKNEVWTFPFTLQRFNQLLARRIDWEDEVQAIMKAVAKVNTLMLEGNRRQFSVISSERCYPHVTFRRMASIGRTSTTWDDHAITNLLILTTAFEREIGALATPEYLLQYKPMTFFLTKRKLKKMDKERQRMWKQFRRENENDKTKSEEGRLRKQRRWQRKVKYWQGHLKDEDQAMQRRDELLGEKGKAWWEELYERIEDGEAADLTRDIIKRTMCGHGARLFLGLNSIEEQGDLEDNNNGHGSSFESDAIDNDTNSAHCRPSYKRNASLLSVPSSRLSRSPRVSSISFAIPLCGLTRGPLLAYIDLVAKLLLFSSEIPKEDLFSFTHRARKDGKRAELSPLQELSSLAEKLALREGDVMGLKEATEPYLREGGVGHNFHTTTKGKDPFWAVEKSVRKRYEDGRRLVVTRTHQENKQVELESGANSNKNKDAGEGDQDTEKTDGDDGETIGNKGGLPLNYLERYDFVEGYLVPEKMKILGLLEALEATKKERFLRSQKVGDYEDDEED